MSLLYFFTAHAKSDQATAVHYSYSLCELQIALLSLYPDTRVGMCECMFPMPSDGFPFDAVMIVARLLLLCVQTPLRVLRSVEGTILLHINSAAKHDPLIVKELVRVQGAQGHAASPPHTHNWTPRWPLS